MTQKIKDQKKPDKLVDPTNKNVEIDANIDEKARRLLQEGEHPGDEHYPGQENSKRISLTKDLPRRT